MQRHDVLAAIVATVELHQLHQQFAAIGEGPRLQQRLLGRRIEGRDLGDTIDQRAIVQPFDRIPVDAVALRIRKMPRLPLDLALRLRDDVRDVLNDDDAHAAHAARPRKCAAVGQAGGRES